MTQIIANYSNNTQKSSVAVQGKDNQKTNTTKDTKKDAKGNNVSGESVYGGSLNLAQDAVAEKKAQAGKMALKRIMDQFSGEDKVDREITKRAEHIQEMESDIAENQGQVRDIENAKSDLMQEYKVDPEGQEQQDVELLEKRQDIVKGRYRGKLTEQETARLGEIDAAGGPTEYQSRVLELDDRQAAFQDRIDSAENSRAEDNGVLKGIHKARLRLHEMVDASKDAQEILDNASKEIAGMLISQAVDEQDKQMDDIKDAAKKKKEEKEKQEEIKTQNKQNTQDTQNTDTGNHTQTNDSGVKQAAANKDVQQEILQAKADQMVAEKKMTQEDVKGLACDEKV